ncbi:MAG TPA: DUF2911 domain-containing protein [Gemmatimonadales bacterium]|nr:DUF2911 domain-containing protein [Gemmatimonadales bacterium]
MYLSAMLATIAAIVAPLPSATAAGITHADTACAARNVPVPGRKSPLDSVSFTIANKPVKVCYGRPSSRGRVMLGGKDVPYGKLWRTGANEPTIFFTPIPLQVAGLPVPPGVYSLYTVPGPKEWEIIVNRSVAQWGKEDQYTDAIKAQELGRAKVKSEKLAAPVETFTIRAEPAGNNAASLALEWEKTRVRIPISAEKQQSS